MALENQFGALSLEATQLARLGGGKTAVPFTVTAAGAPFTYTPAAGKAVRLYWVTAAPDPAAGVFPRIRVLLGAVEVYRVRGAIAHWEIFQGAADEALSVRIDTDATVDGTLHIEEI